MVFLDGQLTAKQVKQVKRELEKEEKKLGVNITLKQKIMIEGGLLILQKLCPHENTSNSGGSDPTIRCFDCGAVIS